MLVFMTLGCGGGHRPAQKTGQVSGTIQLDGTPLRNVIVTFEDPARGLGASAMVNDGQYQFDTPLVVGDYAVTIKAPASAPTAFVSSPGDSGAQAIPTQYQETTKSGLVAHVREGKNTFDFQLKR